MEHHESPIRLAWGHWLSCGLSIGFLYAGMSNSDLSLRYPLPFAGWLLANVALAVWRLSHNPCGPLSGRYSSPLPGWWVC